MGQTRIVKADRFGCIRGKVGERLDLEEFPRPTTGAGASPGIAVADKQAVVVGREPIFLSAGDLR